MVGSDGSWSAAWKLPPYCGRAVTAGHELVACWRPGRRRRRGPAPAGGLLMNGHLQTAGIPLLPCRHPTAPSQDGRWARGALKPTRLRWKFTNRPIRQNVISAIRKVAG